MLFNPYLTSYRRPDATVKMLISALSCGCTVVLAFPIEFTIEYMLFNDGHIPAKLLHKVGSP